MKTRLSLFVLVLVASVSAAHAQGGCIDSPECPTALLAVVGAAGVGLVRRFKK